MPSSRESSFEPTTEFASQAGSARAALLVPIGLALALGFGGGWLARGVAGGACTATWLEPAESTPPESERPSLLPRYAGTEPLDVVRRDRSSSLVTDSASYFRRVDGSLQRLVWPEHSEGELVRTTGVLGLRLTAPLPAERPRPLVVITGDSHVDGVCSDSETAAAVLERSLAEQPGGERARVLNAAVGMYTFPNYLGAAWRYLQLEPDVFVVVVYGGNDFGALDSFEAELRGEPAPTRPADYSERLVAAGKLEIAGRTAGHSLWQALNQIALFDAAPELAERALERAVAHLVEIDRLARERGTRFLAVYLPPGHDVRPELVLPLYAPVLEVLELDAEAMRATDSLADRMLAELERRGVECLDARPALRARTEPLYWVEDEHLNVLGQAVLGEVLAERLAEPIR